MNSDIVRRYEGFCHEFPNKVLSILANLPEEPVILAYLRYSLLHAFKYLARSRSLFRIEIVH